MKKTMILIVACALTFITTSLVAQPLSQGKITYKVVEASEGMPTEVVLTFSKSKSHWEWKNNGISIIQIVNPDNKEGGILYTEKGTKLFNSMSPELLTYFSVPGVREYKKSQDTATIAGITTNRYSFVIENTATGDVRDADVWMDPNCINQLPSIGGIAGKLGLPLEFDVWYNGSMVHLKGTSVSRKAVDESIFAMPKGLAPRQETTTISDSIKIKEPAPVK